MNANIFRFERKKSRIENRLQRDYIKDGIAVIPCHVSSYSNVISAYSVEGCEALDAQFVYYVRDSVGVIPKEYPVVLNITGCDFSDAQQQRIRKTVQADFDYDLGVLDCELRHHMRIILTMLAGLLITGILIWTLDWFQNMSRELVFVLFWFAADTLVDYLFITGRELRLRRILAGRLACCEVTFTGTKKDSDRKDATR